MDVSPSILRDKLGEASDEFHRAAPLFFATLFVAIARGLWRRFVLAFSWRYKSVGSGGYGDSNESGNGSEPRRSGVRWRVLTRRARSGETRDVSLTVEAFATLPVEVHSPSPARSPSLAR